MSARSAPPGAAPPGASSPADGPAEPADGRAALWSGALLAWGLLLAAAGPPAVQAQEDEGVRVGIEYEAGYVPGMAVTSASGRPALEDVAVRVDSILRRDLEYSDRFDMLAVPDTLGSGSGVNYGLWNELGAVWLVSTNVSGTADRPRLRVSLHDITYSRLEEVQSFELPAPGARGFRMAVHRASDAVVRWATGEPGMAASRIAFRRRAEEGESELYTIGSDGRNLRRITSDSSIVYSPSFSPDGGELMYVSYRSGTPEVYGVDLGSGRSELLETEEDYNITPAYSPDGARMMVAQSVGSRTEIFEYELGPLCCRRQVTSGGSGDALNPSFSPDGSRIAFTANRVGQPQVYVKDASGGPAEIVSRYVFGEEGYATSPDWSPTGGRIAYHARVDGVFQIHTVNPDGSNRRVLTTTGENEDPAWAPDGRHLVFASDREGYRALWILDTVTGRLRRLTVNEEDEMPEWSGSIVPAVSGG